VANGLRYAPSGVLVGGTRQRYFDGTHFKPRKLPENAQTPTTMAPTHFVGDRVHAVLGGIVPGRGNKIWNRNSFLPKE
jgi:hypothetical protein